MGGIGAGGGARTPPPAGPFLLPSRALAPQPLETQPSSIEQTGHAESEFSSSCRPDLEDNSSLLPDCGRPRGAGGAALGASVKPCRFRSQGPWGRTRAVLLTQQLGAARGQERQPQDKGDLSVTLPPAGLWFWPRGEGESSKPTLGISGFFSKLTSSCARTSSSGLPSREASPRSVRLLGAEVTSCLECDSEIEQGSEGICSV